MNIKLYELMKKRECHIYQKKNIIRCWIILYFFDLEDFVKIIGADWFEEGGMEVTMGDNYISIDLSDIIEDEGRLVEYKKCFSEHDYSKVQYLIEEEVK